ncbi:MAG: mucoidy inhibitor MuiA family protein [bacterium]
MSAAPSVQRLAVAFALALAPAPRALAAQLASHAIEAVTVLEDRALVTRSVATAVEAGASTVEIGALEAGIDPLSIDVSSGDREVAIVAVDLDSASREPDGAASDEARAIRDEADRLLERIERLDAERSALDDASAVLARYETLVASALANAGSGSVAMDATAWQQATRFLSEQRQALAGSRHQLERDTSELRDQWSLKLAAALERGRAASREHGTRIRVAVATDRARTVTLGLRYAVGDAGWRPSYDARVTPSGAVTLTQRALVAQRSGVDWVDVDLTLATRRADRDVRLPALSALRADFAERDEPERRAVTSTSEAVVPDAQADHILDAPPAEITTTALAAPSAPSAAAAPLAFRLDRRVTIPADGSPHSVVIRESPLAGETRLYAAPEQSLLAYARLETRNPFAESLLDGPLQVVGRAGQAARTRMPVRAPGEDLELFLGADDAVRITRTEIERGQTVANALIGGRKRLRFAYRVSVRNVGRDPRAVTIAERIPVSELDEIEVALEPTDPATTRASKDGILEWDLDLSPGATRSIELRYTVTVPGDFDWDALRP